MESSEMNLDGWVESRLALLEPSDNWRPNAVVALEQLRARGQARRIGRGPIIWAAAAVLAALVLTVVLSLSWFVPRAPQAVVQLPAAPAVKAPAAPQIPQASPRPPVAKLTPPKPVVTPHETAPLVKNYKEVGSPAAPVTLEVFLDYECPHCAGFCRDVLPTLITQYVQTGKIRLRYRDFPLVAHRYAKTAARYANAAGEAGYYQAAADQIFKTLSVWSIDGNIDAQLAKILPADVLVQVRASVQNDPALDAALADDLEAARRDQITFVPAVLLVAQEEHHLLSHIGSFDELKTQIDQFIGARRIF